MACQPSRRGSRIRALAALALLPVLVSAGGDRCGALTSLASPTLEITSAAEEAGACRVTGFARPNPKSRIGFEFRLPVTRWTGRYVQMGTGGFAGMLFPNEVAAEARRGNAAGMTDSGHQDDRMSAAWADGNRQAVTDYGHASIKATSDVARKLVAAYYGRPARWRYFVGCSNGGRQGLVAAARYPRDWNGVLTGSPANPWTEQLSRMARLQHDLRALGPIDLASKLPMIQQAALASCPAGSVSFGAARDPRQCRFDPASLSLPARETQALRLIIAAGYEPTTADAPESWAKWVLGNGSGQAAFADQAFRHLLQTAPDWTLDGFDEASDRAIASRIAPTLDASPDLRAFANRGGRILSYAGWADHVIAPRLSLEFYAAAARRSGDLSGFYRLFMIPGMGHCQGGIGPTSFGQAGMIGSGAPQTDIRAALQAWVEQGRIPDTIIASNETGDTITIAREASH